MAVTVTPDLDVRRPFRYAAALASGIRPAQLRSTRYRKLFNGVYISAEVGVLPMRKVEAALLIHPPRTFASYASAARVFDTPLPAGLDEEHISAIGAGVMASGTTWCDTVWLW